MAVNPMQRKATNSFLLGILITLIIAGIIIGFLIMYIANLNKQLKEAEAETTYAYVITDEVKAGQEITIDKVKGIELKSTVKYAYEAKVTDKTTGKVEVDEKASMFPAGLKAKLNLTPGTIVTNDIILEEEEIKNDVRRQEYNIITLPSQLQSGEYVDIRLRLPSGQDYIVVSHKEAIVPNIAGVDSTNCIWLDLDETEILMMSNAIVESYKAEGSSLYATRYVEPGLQEAASLTYIPSDGVLTLMNKDKNALQEAKDEIFKRNNDASYKTVVRNPINSATNYEDANDNVIDKTTQEVQGLQEEREKYIESLGG